MRVLKQFDIEFVSARNDLDLPDFTTAMDGGSAGAAGSGFSKNLEGLHSEMKY